MKKLICIIMSAIIIVCNYYNYVIYALIYDLCSRYK